MDVERIKVTCSSRRMVNGVKKLHTREIISSKRYHGFNFEEERFRYIRLQEEYHTYNPEEYLPFSVLFMNQRSKIIKLLTIGDVVFALAQSGVCTTFSRGTRKRICFLNVSANEVIRGLFYNETNDSMITISCASESISSLIYRTTSIKDIRRGEPNAGFRLFESDSTKLPSIVEFDGVNGKIVMYFIEDKIYKVFDLKNYALVYSVLDDKIQDITTSPGFLLLVYKKNRWVIPLNIVSIENGTVLKSFGHKLHKNKKVVFIQQFNEKLLFKQEDHNLQIVDVQNCEVTNVSQTEFLCPSSLILWHENQLFLIVTNQRVMVWNLRGELVTSLEDHVIRNPYYITKNVYFRSNGELITASSDGSAGSIIITNILTGKCVGKITKSNTSKCIQASSIRSTVAEALEDITYLTYDEERNEIFTGNRLGEVHVWTN